MSSVQLIGIYGCVFLLFVVIKCVSPCELCLCIRIVNLVLFIPVFLFYEQNTYRLTIIFVFHFLIN